MPRTKSKACGQERAQSPTAWKGTAVGRAAAGGRAQVAEPPRAKAGHSVLFGDEEALVSFKQRRCTVMQPQLPVVPRAWEGDRLTGNSGRGWTGGAGRAASDSGLTVRVCLQDGWGLGTKTGVGEIGHDAGLRGVGGAGVGQGESTPCAQGMAVGVRPCRRVD